NTNVNVLFSGATVSGDNTTLALNNQTDSTSAQGVGVQVLYNEQPITFGTLLPTMQNVAQGSVILPFQAQIMRLNEELKAGEVNATATFEMIYR
ncbi:fimbrial protein, partial [Salmonella enterica]